MRLTCIIALALALSAQPLVATAQANRMLAPAWAPGRAGRQGARQAAAERPSAPASTGW